MAVFVSKGGMGDVSEYQVYQSYTLYAPSMHRMRFINAVIKRVRLIDDRS